MTPRIGCSGVHVAYGPLQVLSDVTLHANAGEILALLGPSGAGKSTLLRILHGLEAPTRGAMALDGAPIPATPPVETLRRFALVQQKPGLLRATALDNVAFPLRARGTPRTEARARAQEALAALGLTERAEAPAPLLSGGEAQRVALARALVTRPDVLLLDEFTNNLDPENGERAEAAVRAERDRGACIVLVTHSLAQARRLADRVAFLDAGRVVEEGPAGQVLTAPVSELVRRFILRG